MSFQQESDALLEATLNLEADQVAKQIEKIHTEYVSMIQYNDDTGDYPALVVELKWNKDARTAIQQIKEKKYPDTVRQYTGKMLLVGINYDKKTKEHSCIIEKVDGE